MLPHAPAKPPRSFAHGNVRRCAWHTHHLTTSCPDGCFRRQKRRLQPRLRYSLRRLRSVAASLQAGRPYLRKKGRAWRRSFRSVPLVLRSTQRHQVLVPRTASRPDRPFLLQGLRDALAPAQLGRSVLAPGGRRLRLRLRRPVRLRLRRRHALALALWASYHHHTENKSTNRTPFGRLPPADRPQARRPHCRRAPFNNAPHTAKSTPTASKLPIRRALTQP